MKVAIVAVVVALLVAIELSLHAENLPPMPANFVASSNPMVVPPPAPQNFIVAAFDQNNRPVAIVWNRNGGLASTGLTWSFTANDSALISCNTNFLVLSNYLEWQPVFYSQYGGKIVSWPDHIEPPTGFTISDSSIPATNDVVYVGFRCRRNGDTNWIEPNELVRVALPGPQTNHLTILKY
jgi:hypothetical protein